MYIENTFISASFHLDERLRPIELAYSGIFVFIAMPVLSQEGKLSGIFVSVLRQEGKLSGIYVPVLSQEGKLSGIMCLY
jgi:hypothetical protein